MKKLIAFLLILPALALAQNYPNTPSNTPQNSNSPATSSADSASTHTSSSDNPDHDFYQKLAEGGMAEVDAGKLAQKSGSSQAVKDFGAMMVKDHSAANEKLKKLAASKNIKLPEGPGMTQKAKKEMLEIKSGASFDKSYIEGQIKAHQDTVELLKQEISSGKDPDAKAFAQEVLPKVESHLKHINQIAADAGVEHGS